MSVHKVPQDVEAEDKLIGPFTFKQMILLLIAGFIGFFMVILARVSIFLAIIPLPVFLVFLFFGVYRRKDQSVETYVAAILRFYFKPRKRIWDKDGILETVIITAPKQVAGIAIDNMNKVEVKNRLNTLGALMDTRGWSAKNASVQDGSMVMDFAASDRLVVPTITQEPTEVHESDDIMNFYASTHAQNIADKTSALQESARTQAVQKMQQAPTTSTSPTTGDDSEEDLPEIHYQSAPTMHQNVLQPMSHDAPAPADPQSSASVMTTDVPTGILNLSTDNNRSVESIAKEADKILESGDTISLHGS